MIFSGTHIVIARSDSDEAIQLFREVLDCFAPLAMTKAIQSKVSSL